MQSSKDAPSSLKGKLSEEFWLFLAGPAFLLCTIAMTIWLHQEELLYWLAAALSGLFLCVRYKISGCIFAVGTLALFALVRHGLFLDQHLWNFGLEGSLACGFVIAALAADQRSSLLKSLHHLSETQGATIGHLEQNVTMLMEASQAQQISLQEKIETKQKELEEVQSELSSILILNEVLRKTSASQLEESNKMAEILLDRDRRIGYLLAEREELSQTVEQLQNETRLVQENEQLLHELNANRVDHEQMRNMSEMIAHLTQQITEGAASNHLEEEKKLLEARNESMSGTIDHLTQKLASQEEAASSRFRSLSHEKQKLQEAIQSLEGKAQKLSDELNQSLVSLKSLEMVREEKNALEREHQKLIEKNRETQEKIRTLEESLAEAAQQLADQKDPSSKAFYELKAEKKALQEALEAAKSTHQTLEHRVQQLSEELGESLTSLQKLGQVQIERNLLQERLRGAEEELAGLMKKSSAPTSSLVPTEVTSSLISLKKLEELQTEKNFFQERLKAAELELSRLAQKAENSTSSAPVLEKPALQVEREILLAKLSETESERSLLEERLKKVSQVEAMYQQLKLQFEERNTVLHETRTQLFHADTELQKLRIEKQQENLESDPCPAELSQEISALEQQISELHQENEQLQQIISDLLKKP